jgi:hypothetical protein
MTSPNNQNYFTTILEFKDEFLKAFTKSPLGEYYSSLEFPNGEGVSNTPGCGFCLHRKPNRTHHCSQCKACVMKLDHHCFVLSSCIGAGNYKPFFLTLFYVNILNIYVLTSSLSSLKFYFNEYQVSFNLY